MTKRDIIDSLRQKLNERVADTNFSNQFLYNSLMEQARWLIKREVSEGGIYTNNSIFQTLKCIEVIEVPSIDNCCPVKTNCKIFRTKKKLPELWTDNNGPIIRTVTSVDGSTNFQITSPVTWQSKKNDPYQRDSSTKYVFYSDGYLWFPENNPNFAKVEGFFIDDISNINLCSDKKDCIRFLDTTFSIPQWIEAEMYAKTIDLLVRVTKQLPSDEQIDKNETRKN